MKESGMKATSARKLLLSLFVLIIIGGGAGIYFGLEQIKTLAVDVSHTTADAHASEDRIEGLQKLQQALAQRESLISKANKLFTTDTNYQSQALTDIQRYASKTGVAISSTDFNTDNQGATGLGGRSFTVKLKSPVAYDKLLKFMNAIEGNLPKMQITKIEISRPSAPSGNDVNVGDISITVSTR